MIGEVVALEPAEFAEWLQGGPVQPPEVAGEMLFAQVSLQHVPYRCGESALSPAGRSLRQQSHAATTALRDGGRSVRARVDP